MNFFEQQERARTRTGLLVGLFAVAVALLIAATCVLVAVFATAAQVPTPEAVRAGAELPTLVDNLRALPRETIAGISLLVVSVVSLAALFKFAQLAGGGARVAEALGGRLLNVSTRDSQEKRLLNVVEEMAIASGIPVPPVYLLDEPGINAFAAGTSPQNAAIGITRGALDALDRDELQGVIAHEFSHIFNGDMRLNLRLIGLLHGILVLGTVGYYLMRAASRGARVSRRDQGNGALALMALGGGLMLIGYAGTFFGNLIKAAVSRQREFLADASAVQFTRNPRGIGGALKKIGGYEGANPRGSMLAHPGAGEVSHLFFAQGISFFLNTLFATHPPLPDRIRRIEPRWQPEQATQVRPGDASKAGEDARIAGFAAGAGIVEAAGQVSAELLDHAAKLYGVLPQQVVSAIHEPYAARALVFCLLLDRTDAIRASQLALLRAHCDSATFAMVGEIQQAVQGRDAQYLEMLDLAMPALKQLGRAQAKSFIYLVHCLIRIDNRIELLEWALYNIVQINLDPPAASLARLQRVRSLQWLGRPLALVLSVVAYAGVYESLFENTAPSSAQGETAVARSFAAGTDAAGMPQLALVPRQLISVDRFVEALKVLGLARPLQKPRILKALLAAIAADEALRPLELQLLRAIALSLDCPLPPVDSSYSKLS